MNQALLAGTLGLALTGLVGYTLIHVPQRRTVELINQQIAEEREHRQTQGEVAALLQELDQHRRRMPPEPDPAWLVRRIVLLTEQSGVQFTAISQNAPESFGEFTRLSVTVELTASYHQLGSFLDRIEESDAFIRLDRINISPFQQQEPGAVTLTFSTLHLPSLARELLGGEAEG